ncbi:hypothetical protein ACLOJK_024317 [Asimina triloba]
MASDPKSLTPSSVVTPITAPPSRHRTTIRRLHAKSSLDPTPHHKSGGRSSIRRREPAVRPTCSFSRRASISRWRYISMAHDSTSQQHHLQVTTSPICQQSRFFSHGISLPSITPKLPPV